MATFVNKNVSAYAVSLEHLEPKKPGRTLEEKINAFHNAVAKLGQTIAARKKVLTG